MDLAANFLHEQAPLFRGMLAISRKLSDFLTDQIEIQSDRTERVADLMGHLGGHGADGGKTLGLELCLLSPRAVGHFLLQRRRSQLHRFFEVVVRRPKRREQENHADEQNQQHQRVPIQDGSIGVRVARGMSATSQMTALTAASTKPARRPAAQHAQQIAIR